MRKGVRATGAFELPMRASVMLERCQNRFGAFMAFGRYQGTGSSTGVTF